MVGQHNTHPASFLLQFVHWSICDTKAVQLGAGVPMFVLEAVDTALDELHVVLGECAGLVCEDVLHLQEIWLGETRKKKKKHKVFPQIIKILIPM